MNYLNDRDIVARSVNDTETSSQRGSRSTTIISLAKFVDYYVPIAITALWVDIVTLHCLDVLLTTLK